MFVSSDMPMQMLKNATVSCVRSDIIKCLPSKMNVMNSSATITIVAKNRRTKRIEQYFSIDNESKKAQPMHAMIAYLRI